MSVITFLVLFFLCFSLHACNARLISSLDKKLEKKTHFFIKNDNKNDFDPSQKQLGQSLNGNKKMQTRLVGDTEKPIRETRSINQTVLKAKGKEGAGSLQTESLVSVSWRVPHKKPAGEKNPGFNLDYSPPKTHPPSHN